MRYKRRSYRLARRSRPTSTRTQRSRLRRTRCSCCRLRRTPRRPKRSLVSKASWIGCTPRAEHVQQPKVLMNQFAVVIEREPEALCLGLEVRAMAGAPVLEREVAFTLGERDLERGVAESLALDALGLDRAER